MQAVIQKNTLTLVQDQEIKKLSPEAVFELLKVAEMSEPKERNAIENQIVSIGERAVPALINRLMSSQKGISRGIAAMSLIRIGSSSVSYIKEIAVKNADFRWIADYLLREIQGSKLSLSANEKVAV